MKSGRTTPISNTRTPVYVLTLMATLGQSAVMPVLAIYSSSMGASHSMVGGIIAVYAASQLVTQVPVGRLSDRIGRKKLILGAFVATALLAIPYHFAFKPVHFLLLQAATGLAAGCLWPPILGQLADLTPHSQRGRAMGTFNTLFFIGVGSGPLLGSYAASTFGYTSVFKIWAVASGLAALFCAMAFKELAKMPSASSTGPTVKHETTSLLKPGYRPSFLATCAVRARGGLCQSFNNSVLPLYAVLIFSATQPMIGALMAVHSILIAAFNIPGGLAADRWGRKAVAVFGSLLATVGVIWYSFPQSYWTLFAAVGLAGAGAAFSSPALAALTGDMCHPKRQGEGYGYFLTSFQIGIIFGALVYGVLADAVGLRLSVITWGISSLGLSLVGLIIKETLSRQGRPAATDSTSSPDTYAS